MSFYVNIFSQKVKQAITFSFLDFKHHKTFLLRFSPLIKIGRKKAEVKGQGDDSQEYLQHAEFVNSETEEEGVGVIFVTENNIYHQPDLTNRNTE